MTRSRRQTTCSSLGMDQAEEEDRQGGRQRALLYHRLVAGSTGILRTFPASCSTTYLARGNLPSQSVAKSEDLPQVRRDHQPGFRASPLVSPRIGRRERIIGSLTACVIRRSRDVALLQACVQRAVTYELSIGG